jgi:hypothetical protein
MKILGSIFLANAALLACVMAPGANAAVISTAAGWSDTGQSYHACMVTNVSSKKLIGVKTELVADSGVVGTSTSDLASGTTNETRTTAADAGGFAWCRISVKNKNAVRASLTIYRSTGTYYDVLGNYPAQ